jgi:hypothetical protein
MTWGAHTAMTMKGSDMNLHEYADANKVPNAKEPWWTSLPLEIVHQVLEGYATGIPKATIVRWLKAEGHTGATVNKLNTLLTDNGVN